MCSTNGDICVKSSDDQLNTKYSKHTPDVGTVVSSIMDSFVQFGLINGIKYRITDVVIRLLLVAEIIRCMARFDILLAYMYFLNYLFFSVSLD